MALQPSGAITLQQIALEFGGATINIRLQDYYAGAGKVPAGTLNGSSVAIPTSGAIRLEDFYGASNVTFPVNSSGPGIFSQGAPGGSSSGHIAFNSDGSISHSGSGSVKAGQYGGPATWASPTSSGMGAGYQLIVDSVASGIGGGTPSGPSVGSWLTMNGTISFDYSNSGNRGPDYEWNCRIRNASSLAVVATFQVSISLENT